jgi:hypothetical protein
VHLGDGDQRAPQTTSSISIISTQTRRQCGGFPGYPEVMIWPAGREKT